MPPTPETSAGEPPASGSSATGESKAVERVAVVFVHGQGQQTPMTDVIELAESVWRTDVRAAGPAPLAPVYSVPVYDGDASEQRRIVTREVEVAGRADGVTHVQADFFQFYWADLMQGNRFSQLWKWFLGLVQKDPRENVVPAAILPLRRLTLGIAISLSLWGLLLALSTTAALVTREWLPCFLTFALAIVVVVAVAVARASAGGDPNRPRPAKGDLGPPLSIRVIEWLSAFFQDIPVALAVLLAAFGAYLTVRQVSLTAAELVTILLALAIGLEIHSLSLPRSRGLGGAFGLGLGLIAACLAIGPFTDEILGGASPACAWISPFLDYLLAATLLPAIGVGIVGYILTRNFLVPVMTESARMFTPSPDNVGNQERIRERGLKLLQYLHGAEANYDRIVVLAHSLGTAVAYNTLTYYWGKVNDSLDHAASTAARDEVARCAGALIERKAGPDSPEFRAWRAAVRAYGRALRKAPEPDDQGRTLSAWRISDLITIGSPLTYAPFLMEPTDDQFIEQVETYRRYPLCPPQPVEDGRAGYHFDFPNGPSFTPHHAAYFAATGWTNLYFPAKGLVWGDLIGGPIAGPLGAKKRVSRQLWKVPERRGLGYGVLDCAVPHDAALGSFTHNAYWPWPNWTGLRNAVGEPVKTDAPPAHIALLRAAFHFFAADPAKSDEMLISVRP